MNKSCAWTEYIILLVILQTQWVWITVRLKNISLMGAELLACPGRPRVSGRPCVRYVTYRPVSHLRCSVHRMWNGEWMVVVTAVLLSLTAVTEGRDYSDLQGPYCAGRASRCCPDRRDDCSVPILGTRCYCDGFCNRTSNEDCCPDYWKVCLGMDINPAPFGRMYLHVQAVFWS